MSASSGSLAAASAPRDIFLIAGEESGDQLGMKLMQALRTLGPRDLVLRGVGGGGMQGQGLESLFPMSEIAVMGFLPVLARLPLLLVRIRDTVEAIINDPPDVLVLIDSPDFTHRVARRVRRRLPDLPIVDYVSPTVWAWRPGRARAMRRYVDHVLALLPFEPAAHERLGGPACTYVGHPLIERLDQLTADAPDLASRPMMLVLPGSRRSEVERLLPVFGETIARIAASHDVDFVLPAVDHVYPQIAAAVATWPVQPRIVRGEAEKFAAFRKARVALAASGTVTLELALAGVPMAVAYRVSKSEERLVRALATVTTVVLPNLVLGDNAIPQFLQEACTADHLAPALLSLLADGPPRAAQIAALTRVREIMQLRVGETPSSRAASIILRTKRT